MYDFCTHLAVLGQLLVDVNCTTNVEAKTHTISVHWQVDPNLNLTSKTISNRLREMDVRAYVTCSSTNKSIVVSMKNRNFCFFIRLSHNVTGFWK